MNLENSRTTLLSCLHIYCVIVRNRNTHGNFSFVSISFSSTANQTTEMPALNKPAPAFAGTAVINGEFKEINLAQYKGKYLVLFFYPLDL